MSTSNNKATAGAKGKTKDYITQIKKESDVQKDQAHLENEDNEWNKYESDEEDTQAKKNVVVEQGKVGSDKPKKLKDLFGDTPQPKQTKPSKPVRYDII
jgi:hypothetical protein